MPAPDSRDFQDLPLWRRMLHDRCVAARAGLPADTLVLDGGRHTPAELADQVQVAL